METFEAITLFLVDKIGNITQTQWNKLLFFTDGAGVCIDTQYTDFTYIKLPYGPVPDNYSELIYSMHYKEIIKEENSFDSKITLSKALNHSDNLLNAEKIIKKNRKLQDVIDTIIKTFKDWSAAKLSGFSHELDAWKIPPMYSTIDLNTLKNDSFLKERFGEADFGKLLFS